MRVAEFCNELIGIKVRGVKDERRELAKGKLFKLFKREGGEA